jgi:hypothetical protein
MERLYHRGMKPSCLVLLAVLAIGGTAACDGPPSSPLFGADAAAGDAAAAGEATWLPVAPTATAFAWQGAQASLYRAADGRRCDDAKVTIAMGDSAVCYVGADDALRCAGEIGGRVFGPAFAEAGQVEVDQILISSLRGDGNAICVRRRDKTAWCLGDVNHWGQLNTGSAGSVDDWQRWGTRDDLAELATGTFDQMCARYAGGAVECVGNGWGVEPVAAGTSTTGRIWIDTFGRLWIDDDSVYRAGNSRTECQVTAEGLRCGDLVFGEAGHVVDGNVAGTHESPVHYGETACWLTDRGEIFCEYLDSEAAQSDGQVRVFEHDNVIAMAVSPYSDGVVVEPGKCAVSSAGALWCTGTNESGKLGTGAYDDLLLPAMVQPPGSVRVRCNDD